MPTPSRRGLFLCFLLGLLLALPSSAQNRRGSLSSERLEGARKKIKLMMMWNITELLKLDYPTGAKLFPLLGQFEDRRFTLQKEQKTIKISLRKELEKKEPDQARLTSLLDGFIKNSEDLQALQKEQLQALRTVLTPVQQAKLMLYIPKFYKEIQKMIRKAKDSPSIKR